MAKLTEPKHWNYSSWRSPPIEHFKTLADASNGWISIARKNIPEEGHFIELGCAPGYCSAAVGFGKRIKMHGVDFSESADAYLQTMNSVGHSDAELIRADLLRFDIQRTYDVVASFGLIEHFSGADLREVLDLHDRLLRPGGRLIIEVPNFNGFPGFWHRTFDKPSFLLHNIDVMRPSTFDFFKERGYSIDFCDYVGPLEVWGDTGAYAASKVSRSLTRWLERRVNKFSRFAAGVGFEMRGRRFSPALICVATKSGG
jgi:SAM-dependent methyltransferase